MSDASSSWAGVGFVEHEALSAAQADVDTLATGWQNGLTRSLNVETMPQDLVLGLGTNVQAVSIKLQSKLPHTIGFAFPEAVDYQSASDQVPFIESKKTEVKGPDEQTSEESSQEAVSSDKPTTRTRIKPPADLVKLEDRLYFVLQPPLETLLSSN